MTDPRGSHMGGAVRDGRRPIPEWRFVCDERRRPDAAVLAKLAREAIDDEHRPGYLVEFRVGHREPVEGPRRAIPTVRAVYADE